MTLYFGDIKTSLGCYFYKPKVILKPIGFGDIILIPSTQRMATSFTQEISLVPQEINITKKSIDKVDAFYGDS